MQRFVPLIVFLGLLASLALFFILLPLAIQLIISSIVAWYVVVDFAFNYSTTLKQKKIDAGVSKEQLDSLSLVQKCMKSYVYIPALIILTYLVFSVIAPSFVFSLVANCLFAWQVVSSARKFASMFKG